MRSAAVAFGRQALSERTAVCAGAAAAQPVSQRAAAAPVLSACMAACVCYRYYSAFNYYRWWLKEQQPPTPDDFHAQAVKEVQQWRDCVAASSVPDCVRRFQPQQLVKGMYAQFLPVGGSAWQQQKQQQQQTRVCDAACCPSPAWTAGATCCHRMTGLGASLPKPHAPTASCVSDRAAQLHHDCPASAHACCLPCCATGLAAPLAQAADAHPAL